MFLIHRIQIAHFFIKVLLMLFTLCILFLSNIIQHSFLGQVFFFLNNYWKFWISGCTNVKPTLCFLFLFFLNKCFILFYFYFTILYWFCHTSTWIRHRYTCVPHPEPPSHLPPHTILLGHPSAPAPNFLYPASNLDWRFISHMIIHMFWSHSSK